MTEPLNTSFIPKRNPNAPTRQNTTQRVFIGTLIIQIFFFSVLLASLGVFVYEKKLNRDLDAEISALNSAIQSFDKEQMQKVVDLDTRINQVDYRLKHTASVSAIFGAMESATVESVKIESLKLKREDDSKFTIESEMQTDSFDSILFQRGVLERDEKLSVTNINDLKLSNFKSGDKQATDKSASEFGVSFQAELSINSESIPHQVVSDPVNVVPLSQSSENSTTGTSNEVNVSEELEVNQENI
jgi:hypothetical protein